MPKASKGGKGGNRKVYALPTAQKRKDNGVPKLQIHKLVGKQTMPQASTGPTSAASKVLTPASLALLASKTPEFPLDPGPSTQSFAPVDASLTTRDSSTKAFMRELRKVIDRSDVIIQVIDARDPEGTRSKWVEHEVKQRETEGKKLLCVINKIDMVPIENVHAWLQHLRMYFPCMPLKSSTQSQRQHLSQNQVPVAGPSAGASGAASGSLQELPKTSSSLGAPALLQLLKQYALSTPHSALTVGVVGYPNVGKSSLINSLKRSRACGVAAMPGKTRVVQEVVLDKGVKILDCPGVVLEDFARAAEGEEGRRKQAEIMLRNCVKAELVEDPFAPVEVILSKVQTKLLQELYSIPPYADLKEFLIHIANSRGRLKKGGIPDLEAAAVSVLRDWNSGKIPYYSAPPAIKPPKPRGEPQPTVINGDVAMDDRPAAAGAGGDEDLSAGDKVLSKLSEAFSLDGLLDMAEDEAQWEGEEDTEAQDFMIDEVIVAPEPAAPAPTIAAPLSGLAFETFRPMPVASEAPRALPSAFVPRRTEVAPTSVARMFTAEELATLPPGVLDKQRNKQLAKKAKRQRAAVERTEGELMLGFDRMGMDEDAQGNDAAAEAEESFNRLSKKQKRKEKLVRQKIAAKAAAKRHKAQEISMEVEDESVVERRKEQDFANFLSQLGADDSDEEL